MDLEELGWGMGWVDLAQNMDKRECGNESLGSIKCGEILDYLGICWLLKDSAPWSK